MIVLDTHVWVWWVQGDQRLDESARSTLSANEGDGGLGVCAISVWEVAMLVAKGRLRIDRDVTDWMQSALAYPGVKLLPLDAAVAVESTRLPGAFHADPADRLIVATARVYNASLFTYDRAILDFPHVSLVAKTKSR